MYSVLHPLQAVQTTTGVTSMGLSCRSVLVPVLSRRGAIPPKVVAHHVPKETTQQLRWVALGRGGALEDSLKVCRVDAQRVPRSARTL
jgi:hypothetical protein